MLIMLVLVNEAQAERKRHRRRHHRVHNRLASNAAANMSKAAQARQDSFQTHEVHWQKHF